MAETHSVDRQDLMAYLDDEIVGQRAVEIAAHLQHCPECARFSTDFRNISKRLAAWQPEPSRGILTQRVSTALHEKPKRRSMWWSWNRTQTLAAVALATLCAFLLVLPKPSMNHQASIAYDTTERALSSRPAALSVDRRPLLVRTAQLTITTSGFERARTGLEAAVRRHSGYLSNLTVNTPSDTARRALQAMARVPANGLDALLTDLKQLGRVESESQSAADVTAQSVDLEARLTNAHNTEQRLTGLLRDRTGRLADVLAVETELSRVRGEVERMEAQRKKLREQVEYATVDVTITEEYRAQTSMSQQPHRFKDAARAGYQGLIDASTGVIVFLLSYGPVILLWSGLLYLAARLVLRKMRTH